MSASNRGALSLGEVLGALWRHKFKSVFLFLFISALTVGVHALWPRTYQSEAGLFVRVGRESVTLDPTATTGQNISVQESRETELNSVLTVLRSRAVAEQVVDRLGIDVVSGEVSAAGEAAESGDFGEAPPLLAASLAPLEAGATETLDWFLRTTRLRDPVASRDRAIEQVEDSLSMEVSRKSSVINISAAAKTPALAQALAQAVLDVYQDLHLRINRTPGSLEFFASQHSRAENDLRAAEEALRDAKSRSGLSSIESQQEILQEEIRLIETSLLTAQGELAASRSRRAVLQASLGSVEPRLVMQQVAGIGNDALDRMEERLYELKILEQEMLSKYTQEHPQVKAIRQQVKEAEAIMQRQPKSRTESTTAINPNHQKLELDLKAEQAVEAALAARVAELAGQREAVLARLRALNDQTVEIAALQRRAEVLSAAVLKYADNLEQARIDEALQNQQITNVNVYQSPTFVTKPARPNKLLILACGLLLAVTASVGVPLLCEWSDTRVRRIDDVERICEAPVLMTIPRGVPHRLNLK